MNPAKAFVLSLALIASLAIAMPMPSAFAQETAEFPPLPRPRPERDVSGQAIPVPPPQAAPASTPATEAITALTAAPQPAILSARISEGGAPITDGLIWRIFDSTPDANGEMALVAKAEGGAAELQLPPGNYLVHVAYGYSQLSESIDINVGTNAVDLVLDVGALRLNAAVTGDIPISPSLLRFDVLTSGPDSERIMVASDVAANEIVTLNAGTYQIVSNFGDVNAVVRASLHVVAGELTDATLYHHATQVSFKLVSEEGGEAIADVEWTVKSEDGTTIFTNHGAFPSTVLAEGDYLVLAKLGTQVYNRDFQIRPGSSAEVEVLTSLY